MGELVPLYPFLYEDLVRRTLAEDLGRAGDLTTDAVVSPEARATVVIRARREGRIAGLGAAVFAFQCLDTEVEVTVEAGDGHDVAAGGEVARFRGKARTLLSAERTALNFLGHLSGIATTTRGIVRAIAGTSARVVCTRKTTPLLRTLEKFAVKAGGGANHRFGLDDAILIKDNHRSLAGGAAEAVRRARAFAGHLVKIEVEVEDLDDLEAVLALGVDAVLLDNMSLADLRRAVKLAAGNVITEASGGITPETAPTIAATGVDLLSLGWITHSAPVLDLGLDFES